VKIDGSWSPSRVLRVEPAGVVGAQPSADSGSEQGSFSSLLHTKLKPPAIECDFSAYAPLRISHFAQMAVIKKLKPEYPQEAASRGIQGQVQVKILVSSDGLVEKACASGGDELLRKASEAVALQLRFKPNFGFSPNPRGPKTRRYVEDFIVYNFILSKEKKDPGVGIIIRP
jgi:TonB family protein